MISQAALAKHLGVVPMAVSRAVKKGRLQRCVVRGASGESLGLTSLEEAVAEWNANTDYTDAPQKEVKHVPPPEPDVPAEKSSAIEEPRSGVNQSNTEGLSAVQRKNHFEAELKLLKLREAAGELIDASEVEKNRTEVYTNVRSRLLSIPSALKQRRPDTPLATVQLVESLVREALEELSA